MGVPSIRSAPVTCSTAPRVVCCSMAVSRTDDSPRAFGRKGLRVAKTPMRRFPPSRGGRTVGDQPCLTASLNCQMSQMYSKSSSPLTASGTRYSGSKTMRAGVSTMPAWRGMPNLVAKQLSIWAMGCIVCCAFRTVGKGPASTSARCSESPVRHPPARRWPNAGCCTYAADPRLSPRHSP